MLATEPGQPESKENSSPLATPTCTEHMFFSGGIVHKIKLLWSYRLGCALCVPAFVLPTALNHAAGCAPLLWSLLVPLTLLQAVAIQFSFTPINNLIGNSVTHDKSGKVNGIGQTLSAIGRALGPAAVQPLLAWCLANGLPMPLDYHLPFLLVAAIAVLTALPTLHLSSLLNQPMRT
eukprot:TRINITY_DN3747_c0_g1_i3.p1 TRINITY_DN3747_c0_g1~~TRINITY_DN3747_c0_g1_i3.p1  ORF type:complete len:177 (-),score=41.81 TRINITY_DN3747_c0_g1_i3:86-616(-)